MRPVVTLRWRANTAWLTPSRSRSARISSGVTGRTGVRHASSNLRIVCLSMTPAACSPSAVSWIEAITGLRYCFVIARHLCQSSVRYRFDQGLIVISHHLGRQQLERGQFVVADFVLFVLGKAVNENSPGVPGRVRSGERGGLMRDTAVRSVRLVLPQAFNTEEGRRATKGHGEAQTTNRRSPSFSRRAWTLNLRPRRRPLMRRVVCTCASCAGTRLATALMSTIRCRSTRLSARKPSPNSSPL